MLWIMLLIAPKVRGLSCMSTMAMRLTCAAWLFNFSGKPWLTQKYTHAIMDSYYGSTPYHGWEGDEDEGQMGAWFVNSAMGFFEMNGAADEDPVMELSSPLFEKITIKLDPKYYLGKSFVIKAETRHSTPKSTYSAPPENDT